MPRKGGAGGGKGTKAATKAAAKVVQDKTFGMKNKNKSKKVQQYINQVKNQTEAKYVGKKRGDAEPQKTKKQLAAEKAAEFNAIFKPVVDKKAQVAAGVDPKSVLCQYFKAGTCTKGARCKFSHDTAVERKAEKIDIYTDRRDVTPDVNDTMDKWDEAKLRSVVATKAGKNPPTTTDIVCKYFLDAIEAKKYGWFWECPNGGAKCQYRHALPPGFVFQAKKKKEEDEDEEEKVPLEELIEEERRGLKGGTPLTLELFLKWKEDRRIAKEKAALERENAIKAGKVTMSGRELFVYNPDLVAGDDDSAYDDAELRREKEQTEKEMLEEEERKLAEGGDFVGPVEDTEEDGGRDEKAKEKEKEDDEGSTSAPEAITSDASTSGAVEVDEQLFAAEVVDDLPEFDD